MQALILKKFYISARRYNTTAITAYIKFGIHIAINGDVRPE